MKTGFYLIVACFVSTYASIATWDSNNFLPAAAVTLMVWILFIWDYSRRSRKAASRRLRERLFEEHMRSFHNHLRY